MSRLPPIYCGHKALASVVVENCQARQSKEASAESDLFWVAFVVATATATAKPFGIVDHEPPAPPPGEPLQSPIQPDRLHFDQVGWGFATVLEVVEPTACGRRLQRIGGSGGAGECHPKRSLAPEASLDWRAW